MLYTHLVYCSSFFSSDFDFLSSSSSCFCCCCSALDAAVVDDAPAVLVLFVNIFVKAPNKLFPLTGLPLDLADPSVFLQPLDCPDVPDELFFESVVPEELLVDEFVLVLLNNHQTNSPINTTTITITNMFFQDKLLKFIFKSVKE